MALTLDTPRIVRVLIEPDEENPPDVIARVVYYLTNADNRRSEKNVVTVTLTPAQKTAIRNAALAAIEAKEGP